MSAYITKSGTCRLSRKRSARPPFLVSTREPRVPRRSPQGADATTANPHLRFAQRQDKGPAVAEGKGSSCSRRFRETATRIHERSQAKAHATSEGVDRPRRSEASNGPAPQHPLGREAAVPQQPASGRPSSGQETKNNNIAWGPLQWIAP